MPTALVPSILALSLLVACGASHQTDDTGTGADAGPVSDADRVDGGRDAARPRDAGPPDAGRESSDAGEACPPGTAPFEPGCDPPSGASIPAGCYATCAGADDPGCGDGRSCRRAWVDPCVCEPGEPCCGACGAEQWLCLADRPCAGLDYCDCSGGCAPLVDLTLGGCICSCDDPFNCTGEICDCDCGGAEYLGCAARGACEATEVTCAPGCRATLVDGCPACDPSCDG